MKPQPRRTARSLPDPTRVALVLSSQCIGYQLDSDGIITHTVWSGSVKFDGDIGGDGQRRYWTDGGGRHRFQKKRPRIDRAMAERPWGDER